MPRGLISATSSGSTRVCRCESRYTSPPPSRPSGKALSQRSSVWLMAVTLWPSSTPSSAPVAVPATPGHHALDDENTEHGAAAGAHGAQDGDVGALVRHHHNQGGKRY